MKKSNLIVFSAFLCLYVSGCDLPDIVEHGETCPPSNAVGILNYIDTPECTPESCDPASYLENFNMHVCPIKVPKCVADEPIGNYHCARDTDFSCYDGAIICDEQKVCINPADPEHCGATNCDEASNYGGTQCNGDFVQCKKSGTTYSCQCADGAISCDGECISPSANATCGANSCDKDANYNGKVCGQNEACTQTDEGFDCQCLDGYVRCGDKCIDPKNDNEHCGASGQCTSTEAQTADYVGVDCAASNGICIDGQCGCNSNSVWCSIDGQTKCWSKLGNSTCNVHIKEGTDECEFTTCTDLQKCDYNSDGGFFCVQMDCGFGEQICYEGDERKCVSKTDMHRCGSCSFDCALQSKANAVASGCEMNGETPTCSFTCNDGFMNCSGDQFAPECVDLKNSKDHCGACGTVCSASQVCENGTCVSQKCDPDQCSIKLDNGAYECKNVVTACGPSCTNCNLDPSGQCLNGTCVYSRCPDNFHPVYNSSSQITWCDQNSVVSCASPTMSPLESPQNCDTNRPSDATEMACENGACRVKSCATGTTLNSARTACDPIICGGNEYLEGNTCKPYVTNCPSGQHISIDNKSCEPNTNSSCGPTNGHGVACSGITSTCQNGVCGCADPKKAPNANGTACIQRGCMDWPGVNKTDCVGADAGTYLCVETDCIAGFSSHRACSGSETWGSCRPMSANNNCAELGYAGAPIGGYCTSENGCLPGYVKYHLVCLPMDVCCGSSCYNCRAQGKTCDGSNCI